uniref:Uncharacterized protein n=1 Tax=Plectus sambesii TaxID=2011161 RepID=A0A914VLK6_9BILA
MRGRPMEEGGSDGDGIVLVASA